MAPETKGAHARGWFGTQRSDGWWVQPAVVAVALSAFVVYATVAAVQSEHFEYMQEGRQYLSPFYAPCMTDLCAHGPLAGLITTPVVMGYVVPPSFFILWAPVGFRLTCYYYRKAYYRAFTASPSNCGVEAPKRDYKGERAFPLVLQNLHRYFLPFALLLVVFLAYDAIISFNFDGSFGIGVGSLVLTANAVLLAGYTFGCHSLRHIAGGRLDCYTCPVGPNQQKVRAQHWTWKAVSWFNRKHMLWAWLSLFMVGFADLYVRLVSMGIWTDVRLI